MKIGSNAARRSFPDGGLPRLHSGFLSCLGDRVIIRDARGRSAHPALVRFPAPGSRGEACHLRVRGGFTVLQNFSVDAGKGAAFAEVSRDENPLHREGDVVPGAMTAARALLFPELLVDGARVERMRFRFRSIARYGIPTLNSFRLEPGVGDSLHIEVRVRQGNTEVADGHLVARYLSTESTEGDALAECEPTAELRCFLECLCIDPDIYFERMGAAYPSAYFASLPSGEMVRKYSGNGGLLNALDLEFPAPSSPESPRNHFEALQNPLSSPRDRRGSAPTRVGSPLGRMEPRVTPTVELMDSPRSHRTFRKVLARVAQGVRTYCSGFAMVMQPSPSSSL